METYTGFISFELGHFVKPEFDINFVLYPETNRYGPGMNCKASVTDILDSELREYLTQGGICKAVVRGSSHIAGNHEPGWSVGSNKYLRVSWVMREPEDWEEEERRMLEEEYASENEAEEGTIILDDDSNGQDHKLQNQQHPSFRPTTAAHAKFFPTQKQVG
ncbi:hypothetical protein LRAMOSA01551 [Lichtheimia ramosa]|uniref:Uncharacterized protein n=1 Tax=Lichtheimia ramosa TaxID=688394 RepID=A0A077WLY7_9FUNG|nr:hypothetical protein LRAMOSA01551 [Lichtheimia ramosa]